MSRFLFNPVFEMTSELVKWFQMTQPLSDSLREPRVLIRQTATGLHFTKISTDQTMEVVYRSTHIALTPGLDGVEHLGDEQYIEIDAGYIETVGNAIVKFFEE